MLAMETPVIADPESTLTLRWPIRWRLPIWICALLLATVIAVGWAAYRQVETALMDVARVRLQSVARQLVGLLSTSAEQRRAEARRLAARPVVMALVDAPSEATRDNARRELEAFLKASPQTLGLEIWSASGERLLDLVEMPPPGTNVITPPSRTEAPSDPGFSPVLTIGPRAYYELVLAMPARPAPDGAEPARRGFLIIRRQLSAAGAAEAVRGLLGDSITLQVGSSAGAWTDLSTLTPGPPASAPPNGTADYRDASGAAQVGAGALVAGTSWRLWVALPRQAALAPADVFLRRIIPLGVIVVLLGSLVAWMAARRVTKPLDDLTAAAESIAGGALSRRVEVSRRDEIGRLGNAFNAMTVRVKDGYDRLDARVQERTRELEEAVAKLKETQETLVRREKLAMLGQLASGVGHELRNPLGVMTNAVYFLEMVQPDAPPEVREYHALLRAQIGLSEKIVSDLLDFARVKPPRREPVPLSRLVDDQLARVPATDGVVVQRDLPDNLPRANVDPVQIGQVLLNLLVNAVQAMEQQGGVLTVRGTRHAQGVCLDVIDTGPGVPPELQDKIFEALFTTKARGIGLGLAVSRSLAEANGGQLTLSSRPGEGATLTLTMPAVDVPALDATEAAR